MFKVQTHAGRGVKTERSCAPRLSHALKQGKEDSKGSIQSVIYHLVLYGHVCYSLFEDDHHVKIDRFLKDREKDPVVKQLCVCLRLHFNFLTSRV